MVKDYKPSKGILSNEEMVAILNLDDDYSPLSRLEELSKEASQFLYQKTGHDWSVDEEINKTAKGAARDYIYQIWYGGDDHIQRRLEQSIIQLQAIVDSIGNLYEVKDDGSL